MTLKNKIYDTPITDRALAIGEIIRNNNLSRKLQVIAEQHPGPYVRPARSISVAIYSLAADEVGSGKFSQDPDSILQSLARTLKAFPAPANLPASTL